MSDPGMNYLDIVKQQRDAARAEAAVLRVEREEQAAAAAALEDRVAELERVAKGLLSFTQACIAGRRIAEANPHYQAEVAALVADAAKVLVDGEANHE